MWKAQRRFSMTQVGQFDAENHFYQLNSSLQIRDVTQVGLYDANGILDARSIFDSSWSKWKLKSDFLTQFVYLTQNHEINSENFLTLPNNLTHLVYLTQKRSIMQCGILISKYTVRSSLNNIMHGIKPLSQKNKSTWNQIGLYQMMPKIYNLSSDSGSW